MGVIGNSNGYATDEAPKVDFGAVVQHNIDEMVKSKLHGDTLKAARDKAEAQKKYRSLETFKRGRTSGLVSEDNGFSSMLTKLIPTMATWKADYEANGTVDSKVNYDTALNTIKNAQGIIDGHGKDIDGFNKLVSENKVVKKHATRLNAELAKADDVSTDFDPSTGQFLFHQTDKDGKVTTIPVSERVAMFKNVPIAIQDPQKELAAMAASWKDQEIQDAVRNGLDVRTVKDVGLSQKSTDAIREEIRNKLNIDSQMVSWGDATGVIGQDDLRLTGFSDADKDAVAESMVKSITGRHSTKHIENERFQQEHVKSDTAEKKRVSALPTYSGTSDYVHEEGPDADGRVKPKGSFEVSILHAESGNKETGQYTSFRFGLLPVKNPTINDMYAEVIETTNDEVSKKRGKKTIGTSGKSEIKHTYFSKGQAGDFNEAAKHLNEMHWDMSAIGKNGVLKDTSPEGVLQFLIDAKTDNEARKKKGTKTVGTGTTSKTTASNTPKKETAAERAQRIANGG